MFRISQQNHGFVRGTPLIRQGGVWSSTDGPWVAIVANILDANTFEATDSGVIDYPPGTFTPDAVLATPTGTTIGTAITNSKLLLSASGSAETAATVAAATPTMTGLAGSGLDQYYTKWVGEDLGYGQIHEDATSLYLGPTITVTAALLASSTTAAIAGTDPGSSPVGKVTVGGGVVRSAREVIDAPSGYVGELITAGVSGTPTFRVNYNGTVTAPILSGPASGNLNILVADVTAALVLATGGGTSAIVNADQSTTFYGVDPGSVGAGRVTIGGGVVRAAGSLYTGSMGITPQGSGAMKFYDSATPRYRMSFQVNSSGVDMLSFDDIGGVYKPFTVEGAGIEMRLQGGAFTATATGTSFFLAQASDPGSVSAGQVIIGGGVVRAATNLYAGDSIFCANGTVTGFITLGSSVYFGSQTNHPVKFRTNNTDAITIDTSQNCTFSQAVTVTGNVQGANLYTVSGGVKTTSAVNLVLGANLGTAITIDTTQQVTIANRIFAPGYGSFFSGGVIVGGSLGAGGTIYLVNSSVTASTPSGGGVLYVDNTGHLRYRGPSGTDTLLANP